VLAIFFVCFIVIPDILLPMSEAYFSSGIRTLADHLHSWHALRRHSGLIFFVMNSFVASHFVYAAKRRIADISSNSKDIGASEEFQNLTLHLKKVIASLWVGTIVAIVFVPFTLLLAFVPDFFLNDSLSKAYCILSFVSVDGLSLFQSIVFVSFDIRKLRKVSPGSANSSNSGNSHKDYDHEKRPSVAHERTGSSIHLSASTTDLTGTA